MKRFIVTLLILLMIPVTVFAHSGDTDAYGGHWDGGDYHYHHGYPAHDHYDMDGDGDIDCPYNFKNNTGSNSGSGSKFTHTDPNPSTFVKGDSTTVVRYVTPDWVAPLIVTLVSLILGLVLFGLWFFWKKKKEKEALLYEIRSLQADLNNSERAFSKNLSEIHNLLKEKIGTDYLYVLADVPQGTTMSSEGFPISPLGSSKVPWGWKYTVYLGSRSGKYVRYHKLTCRYSCGDMPVHIVAAKEYRLEPCGVCRPGDPDIAWVYNYRRLKKFFDAYVKEDGNVE